MTLAALDSHPKNVFRLVLDAASLLPNNRVASDDNGGADYVTFSDIPDITQRKSASYVDENILGRSEPYKSYQYSGATQFSFTARIVAMGDKDQSWRTISTELAAAGLGLTGRFVSDTQPFIGPAGKLASLAINQRANPGSKQEEIMTTTFKEVTLKAALLESLVYPQYDDQGQAYPPPRVWLLYGQNFTRRGVVKDINIVWKGPWEVSTLLCMVLEVGINFEEVNSAPKGYSQVRNMTRPQSEQTETQYSGTRKTIDNVRSIAGL